MVLDSRKWDARYGHGLLAAHAPEFNSYIAITTPSAWAVVQRFFATPPRLLEFHKGMGESYLDSLMDRLPGADRVLAIGGGSALDVGKYVAWKSGRPLIMIPTIVSTGAVFQPNVPVRRADTWEILKNIIAPEYLLLDFDVISAAPPHLNCAGMGECVCYLGGVGGWRWWTNKSLDGPPWDQAAADGTAGWVRDRARQFGRSLGSNGQPNAEGIRIAVEINRERYDLPTVDRTGDRGVDHAFVCGFQWVHRRELIHGEGVALGSLINAFVYEWGFDETKSLLDMCRVRYRPADIGCTIAEVRAALDGMNELCAKLGWARNWFDERRLDDRSFDRMMAAVVARAS